MSILMYILRALKSSPFSPSYSAWKECSIKLSSNDSVSPRIEEFRKKLKEKTPIGKLEQPIKDYPLEDDPLPPWPNNTNPHTGEIGGPKGPEPTRYGDWERKGRVTDF